MQSCNLAASLTHTHAHIRARVYNVSSFSFAKLKIGKINRKSAETNLQRKNVGERSYWECVKIKVTETLLLREGCSPPIAGELRGSEYPKWEVVVESIK